MVFIRADFTDLVLEQPTAAQATLYSEWTSASKATRNTTVLGNKWLLNAARGYPAVMARPQSCFDSEFYIMVGVNGNASFDITLGTFYISHCDSDLLTILYLKVTTICKQHILKSSCFKTFCPKISPSYDVALGPRSSPQ